MNKILLISMALAGLLGFTTAYAEEFHATINIDPAYYTSGSATLPLQLDFQLNSGGAAPVSNTVTLSGFSFVTADNLAPSFGTASLSGNVSGDLSAGVVSLNDAGSSYNELFQSFSPDVTQINFNIDTSTNINPAAADSFLVALLDSSAGFPQLATTDPLGVSLIALNIANPLDANAYASTGTSSGAGFSATIAAVPLPPSAWLFGSGLAAVAFRKRKSS